MIRSDRAHLLVSASSHPGMTGKNNEDRFAVTAYRVGLENNTPAVLAVLCDGIGGHRAGEVAAEIGVNTITQVVGQSDARQPVQILQNAVRAASQEVLDATRGDSGRSGMGTTCACAWIIGSRLYTITVGDSRIYLQRGQTIFQLSTDHTYVQELLELGHITPDQMKDHPNAHVIRRYLGSPAPPEGDVRLKMSPKDSDERAVANQGLQLQPGDHIILCSDGLTDLVEDKEIENAMETLAAGKKKNPGDAQGRKTIGEVIQDLIGLANERGGHDNITVIAMEVPPMKAVRAKRSGWARTWRLGLAGCLSLILMVLLSVLAVAGWTWWQGRLQPTLSVQNTPLIAATSQSPGSGNSSETPPQPTTSMTAPQATFSSSQPSLPAVTTPYSTDASNKGPTLTPWPTNTLQIPYP